MPEDPQVIVIKVYSPHQGFKLTGPSIPSDEEGYLAGKDLLNELADEGVIEQNCRHHRISPRNIIFATLKPSCPLLGVCVMARQVALRIHNACVQSPNGRAIRYSTDNTTALFS